MDVKRIKENIKNMFCDDNFGFEVYIFMKDKSLKHFLFSDKKKNNDNKIFEESTQDMIVNTLKNKFCNENISYIDAINVSDDQQGCYVVEQNEKYAPFKFLDEYLTDDILKTNFKVNQVSEAKGIFFKFRRNDDVLWAYQKIWSVSIPNRSKKNKLFRQNADDEFEELDNQMFAITPTVNLLIIDDYILTDKINFLERYFDFEFYIRAHANEAVSHIKSANIICETRENILNTYIKSSRKSRANRMMKINQFGVINLSSKKLKEQIKNSEKWKNVFTFTNKDQISLGKYEDINNLIDLLTERFTSSPITGDTFDTKVKTLVKN